MCFWTRNYSLSFWVNWCTPWNSPAREVVPWIIKHDQNQPRLNILHDKCPQLVWQYIANPFFSLNKLQSWFSFIKLTIMSAWEPVSSWNCSSKKWLKSTFNVAVLRKVKDWLRNVTISFCLGNILFISLFTTNSKQEIKFKHNTPSSVTSSLQFVVCALGIRDTTLMKNHFTAEINMPTDWQKYHLSLNG